MIAKDQAKAYEIMGADVKQTGEQFGKSAASTCAGRTRRPNKQVLRRRACQAFTKEAADLLLEIGIIKPDPGRDHARSTPASSSKLGGRREPVSQVRPWRACPHATATADSTAAARAPTLHGSSP